MDMTKLFKGLVSICDQLTKLTEDVDIIASEGIFMWKDDGMLTIATFTEKLEKDAIPFLTGKYSMNPHVVVLLSKYFQILNITRSSAGIKLTFPGPVPTELLADKDASIGLQNLKKDPHGNLFLLLPNAEESEHYDELASIIIDIAEKSDFDRSVSMDIESNDKLNLTERAVELNIGDFFIRIAKSLFVTVNKADKLSVRCTPHKRTNDLFLVTTTNCKEKCKLINFVSALRL